MQHFSLSTFFSYTFIWLGFFLFPFLPSSAATNPSQKREPMLPPSSYWTHTLSIACKSAWCGAALLLLVLTYVSIGQPSSPLYKAIKQEDITQAIALIRASSNPYKILSEPYNTMMNPMELACRQYHALKQSETKGNTYQAYYHLLAIMLHVYQNNQSLEDSLFKAVKTGNIGGVMLLFTALEDAPIQEGYDTKQELLLATLADQATPLMCAVQVCHTDIMAYLLAQAQRKKLTCKLLHKKDICQLPIFYFAVKNGIPSIFYMLWQAGKQVHYPVGDWLTATHENDDTLWHLAARHGHVKMIKQLFECAQEASFCSKAIKKLLQKENHQQQKAIDLAINQETKQALQLT